MFWIIFLPIIALIWFLLYSGVQCLSFLSTSCQQRCLKTTTVQGFCWIQISSSSPLVCSCPACKSERGEVTILLKLMILLNYDLQQDRSFIHTYFKKKYFRQPSDICVISHLMREVGGNCRQYSIVRQSLLSIDSGYYKSWHHGHRKTTQPWFGLLLKLQCSRFDSDFDVIFFILVIKDKTEISLSNTLLEIR